MDYLKEGTVLHGKSYEYKIIQTLGQGTFGITYLASVKMAGALGSLDSEILVAVKEFFMRDFNGRNESSVTYSSKDGAFAYYKSKFIHEAESLSKLKDNGIVRVIELFEENQTAYYVMEYIKKGSLDAHIKSKGSLSPAECVSYARQIAKALSYMHKNKMLHLDLKPNNIMIRDNDEPVLIDFGLSKRFDEYGKPETSTTIGHGTPGYAPIEQANYQGRGVGDFPATMDIYALGATMYKMLTGERPPEASVILNEGFPEDVLIDFEVPGDIIDIVKKCMDPFRKNRYKSADDVIKALDSIEEGTVIIRGGGNQGGGSSDPTLSPVPFRSDTDRIVISHSCMIPVLDGYEMVITPSQLKIKATKGHAYTNDHDQTDGKEIVVESDIFKAIATEISRWNYLPQGNKYDGLDYSEVPDQLSILLYDSDERPYMILNCESISGRNYGNLYGNSYDFNNKIISLIPDFERYIEESKNERNNLPDEDTPVIKKKPTKTSWSDVIFQNIIISIVIGIIALPAVFCRNHYSYIWFCLFWGTLGIMELCGGILFGIGSRVSKKLKNISFRIALIGAVVYVVLWIIYGWLVL